MVAHIKREKRENLDFVRKDFPLISASSKKHPLIYFDNSATSQKPKVVLDRMRDFYVKENANVHRGIYTLSEKATMAYEDARSQIATFIGALPEEIIFTSGTTAGLNLLASSLFDTLALKEGDEVIISVMEHHSNFVCWQQLALKRGVILRLIPLTKGFRLDLKAYARLLSSKTKIVSISHISNVLGTINPIGKICELAHSVGAVVVVDAAQAVAHVQVNVKTLDCDVLAFSGHKMGGPTGIGVVYGKKELLSSLRPFFYGGGMISEVSLDGSTWADVPYRFEAGTPPIAEAIGLGVAVEYLSRIGMNEIEKKMMILTKYVGTRLSKVKDIRLLGPDDFVNRAPIFSFEVRGIHAHDVSEILNRRGIAVRAGHFCAQPLLKELGSDNAVRASLWIYNTKEEIDSFIEALNQVRKVFS